MTRETWGHIVVILKAVYTDQKFLPDKEAVGVWYGLLKDIDDQAIEAAVSKYMMTGKFPPTVAELRAMSGEMTGGRENLMTVGEAFSRYWKAVCNSTYHSEEEFEKLPEIIKKAVGSPEALKEVATRDDINFDVERSLFERRFTTVQNRARQDAQISPEVRGMIAAVIESSDRYLEMCRAERAELPEKKEEPLPPRRPDDNTPTEKLDELREILRRVPARRNYE